MNTWNNYQISIKVKVAAPKVDDRGNQEGGKWMAPKEKTITFNIQAVNEDDAARRFSTWINDKLNPLPPDSRD
jgi:hypothetical protein